MRHDRCLLSAAQDFPAHTPLRRALRFLQLNLVCWPLAPNISPRCNAVIGRRAVGDGCGSVASVRWPEQRTFGRRPTRPRASRISVCLQFTTYRALTSPAHPRRYDRYVAETVSTSVEVDRPDPLHSQYCSHRAHFEVARRVFPNTGYL